MDPQGDVVPPALVQVNMCVIATCLEVCSHGNTDFLLNAKSRTTALSLLQGKLTKSWGCFSFPQLSLGCPWLGEKKKAEIIIPKVSLFQGSLFPLWRREMWGVAQKPAATPDRLSWIRAGDGALQEPFANLHDLPWTLCKTIPFFSPVHGARGNPAPFLLSPGHRAVFLYLERRCLQGEVWSGKEGWGEMHERMETPLLHQRNLLWSKVKWRISWWKGCQPQAWESWFSTPAQPQACCLALHK